MFVRSNEKSTYFYVYVYLLITEKKKKKKLRNSSLPNSSSILQGPRAWEAQVPQKKKKEQYAQFLYLQRTQAW